MPSLPSSASRPSALLRAALPGAGLLLLALAGCAPGAPPPPAGPAISEASPRPAPAEGKGGAAQRGDASFYADHFEGKPMANGAAFSQSSDSAASKTLPLGTKAQVKNLENGRTAVVTIKDRGPHVPGRVIDVSKKTAERLEMVDDGTAPVEVKPLTNTASR